MVVDDGRTWAAASASRAGPGRGRRAARRPTPSARRRWSSRSSRSSQSRSTLKASRGGRAVARVGAALRVGAPRAESGCRARRRRIPPRQLRRTAAANQGSLGLSGRVARIAVEKHGHLASAPTSAAAVSARPGRAAAVSVDPARTGITSRDPTWGMKRHRARAVSISRTTARASPPRPSASAPCGAASVKSNPSGCDQVGVDVDRRAGPPGGLEALGLPGRAPRSGRGRRPGAVLYPSTPGVCPRSASGGGPALGDSEARSPPRTGRPRAVD